jgi:hypothetical protein
MREDGNIGYAPRVVRGDRQARAARAVLAAFVVALAGCEAVFQLDPPHRVDAPPPDPVDGSPPDAGLPDAAPPCTAGPPASVVLEAAADAALGSTTPDQPAGGLGVVNVGVAIQSRGLFRFDVASVLGLTPVELRLTLYYAAHQDDCANSCGSCASIDTAGALLAYAAHSNWDEIEVTWNLRRAGQPWQQGGLESAGEPGSGADRGSLPVAAPHPHQSDTTFVFTGAELLEAWSWIAASSQRLSFLVIPVDVGGGGTVMVVTSREGVATACEPDDQRATLEVVYCP